MDELQVKIDREEDLLSKQKQEKKDLQARVQQLKKSINKDKKRKKEITKEISDLEENLKVKHANELEDLKKETNSHDIKEEVINGINDVNLEDNNKETENNHGKKITKAEKRRIKKSEANKEREALIQEEIANSKYSARNVEADKLKELLKVRKLKMYEIEPDGNCMYAAISHQLKYQYTVQHLRAQTAIFMQENSDDFAPFVTHSDTGDMLTPEQFSQYCHQVENSTTWGGEPELKALSMCLQRRFEVIQAEGPSRTFGEDFTKESPILLPYYRHYYGLGEHYNSVIENKSEENT